MLHGGATPPDLAEATRPQVLARLLPGTPLIVVPRLDAHNASAAARQAAPFVAALLDDD